MTVGDGIGDSERWDVRAVVGRHWLVVRIFPCVACFRRMLLNRNLDVVAVGLQDNDTHDAFGIQDGRPGYQS